MIELIQKRLSAYAVTNAIQEEQALREILQSVVLYALWRVDFFKTAAFQGGTALRILHGLPRFSEDLDFICLKPAPAFQWSEYSTPLMDVLAEFGIHCEFVDRGRMDQAVRAAIIKDDSFAGQLEFSFFGGDARRKQKVKLEIDTNPPPGYGFEWLPVDFPVDFEVCAQTLPSNFALKLHALLCRPYLKGRDWFDFGWYCRQKTVPDIDLLAGAIRQLGPWAGQDIRVDQKWLVNALEGKVRSIDWPMAALDVEPFLQSVEVPGLKLWGTPFFEDKVRTLARILEHNR